MEIKLVFPGEPRAVQSFRFTQRGRKYQPKENVEWKGYIRMVATQTLPSGWTPVDCPVRIKKALFVFAPVKSLKAAQRRIIEAGGFVSKTTKPDLTDNLFKGVIDALTGILYRDDALICGLDGVEKVYGRIPRIELVFDIQRKPLASDLFSMRETFEKATAKAGFELVFG